MPRGFGLKFLRFAEGIWRTLVAAHGENADIYNPRDAYPLFAASIAAWLRGSRVVYDSDELNLDRNFAVATNPVWRFFMLRYERFFVRRAALVITSDFGRADVLRDRYGIDPVVVLNVPDIAHDFEPDPDFRSKVLGNGRYLLIYQGILVVNRGLPELVDAMRLLPECRLAIVGYGALRDEIAARVAADDVLMARVTLVDAVPFETLMRYTASADIGVIPLIGSCLSYRLAAPNKLFEYMACGIPVVATDLEEMRRYIVEEQVGTLIAEPVTPDSIAAAVRTLIEGPEPLSVVGARGRAAAQARYSWAHERPKLIEAYARVSVRKKARRG